MASIKKSGKSYRVQVKHKGRYRSKTLPTLGEARAWAAALEAEFRAADAGQIPNKRVADLLERYAREVSPTKKGHRWEAIRIGWIVENEPLARVNLRDLSASDIAAWRDRRLQTVQGSTVGREWNLLSAAFSAAVREWGWLRVNPMSQVKRPPVNPARRRRPTQEELDRLSHALGQGGGTKSARVADAMFFAIETAMRAGEIAGLRKEDIRGRVARLVDTKNGESRDVPLSKEAIRILESLPDQDPVFGLTARQIDALFRRAKKLALVEGLNFHDMRREALTRLSQKVDVMTLAKISGHKDLRILQNVYYEPEMSEVADLLD